MYYGKFFSIKRDALLLLILGTLLCSSGCGDDSCPVPEIKYSEVGEQSTVGGTINFEQDINGVIEQIGKKIGKAEADVSGEFRIVAEQVINRKILFSQEYFQDYNALRGQICACYDMANNEKTPPDKQNELWDAVISGTRNFYATLKNGPQVEEDAAEEDAAEEGTAEEEGAEEDSGEVHTDNTSLKPEKVSVPERPVRAQPVKVPPPELVPVTVLSKDYGDASLNFSKVKFKGGEIIQQDVKNYQQAHPKGSVIEFWKEGELVLTKTIK